MSATVSGELRTQGIRLVSLLLIVSFAFIPVRCDVSAAPHSIFVSPDMLNESGAHMHHTAGNTKSTAAKAVPHHSPVAHTVTGHQHEPSSSVMTDPVQQRCALSLTGGSDPGSQQPVGATLDLPTTSITPDTTTQQPLDTEPVLLTFAPALVLSGISAPPDAPPPKVS